MGACPPALMPEQHFIQVKAGNRPYQAGAQEALQIGIPLPVTDQMQLGEFKQHYSRRLKFE
jgi:hypothetical protein